MSIRFIQSRKNKGHAPYEVEVVVKGKRKRKYVESKEKAREVEKQFLALTEIYRTNINQAINEYYHSISKRKISHKQEKRYFTVLSIFLEKEGLFLVDEIKHSHLVKLQNWLKLDHRFRNQPISAFSGLSGATINRYFACYRDFFKHCYKNEYLLKNPCEYLDKLSESPDQRRAATHEEYLKYLNACPKHFKPVAQFLYLTGLRGASVADLCWENVHLRDGFFRYQVFKGYRGSSVFKTFPITPEIEALLNEQNSRLLSLSVLATGKTPVFLNSANKPFTAARISKLGNKAIKRAGLNDLVQYCFRHSMAKDLRAAGVELEKIRTIMGHAGIEMTKHYAGPESNEVLTRALTQVRGAATTSGVPQICRTKGVGLT